MARERTLSPENLRRLLGACRIVDLGLSKEQFATVVSLQGRMRQTSFTGLTVEDATFCADLWQRLLDYANQGKPGHEHLAELIWQ